MIGVELAQGYAAATLALLKRVDAVPGADAGDAARLDALRARATRAAGTTLSRP
jgi:hypothetical protein